MKRADKKAIKAIYKEIQHRIHDTDDEFHPHYVTVDGLSEKVGHPEYAHQVKSRIWRKMESDEEYLAYTMIDFNNPDDLCLTADGITAFFDILSGYYDPEALTDVAKYMQRLDKMERNELEIKRLEKLKWKLIKRAPTSMLKGFIAEFKVSGTMAGLKMDDESCDMMEKELEFRTPFSLLKPHMAED